MLKRILLILAFSPVFLLPIFFIFVNRSFADSFYQTNGDTSDCSVSLALGLGYSNLPQNISYNPSSVSGSTLSQLQGLNFGNLATDLYPSAQRFNSNSMSVSAPPRTNISIYGYFKNENPYYVTIPSGSTLFTSLQSPEDSEISNLIDGPFTKYSSSFNYLGKIYTRTGNGINLPTLGRIAPYSQKASSLYSFNLIQPIQAQRTVVTSFDSKGNLILSINLHVVNVSAYYEPNINVKDSFPGLYTFEKTFSLNPNSSVDFSYLASLGLGYSQNIYLPPATISDPNSHTEVFVKGENSYGSDINSIGFVFPRTDEGAPSNWSGNQSSLPILDENAYMSITLIPYSFETDPFTSNIAPNIEITKTQDGVTTLIQKHIGDTIHYVMHVKNSGNAPAANLILFDPLSKDENVIDASDGATVCEFEEQVVNGAPCHNSIVWDVSYIPIGGSIDLSFDSVVANTAYDLESIDNQIYGMYNLTHVVYSNTVSAEVIYIPVVSSWQIQQEVLGSMVSSSGGDIIGFVWDDINANAKEDIGEKGIEGSVINASYLDGNGQRVNLISKTNEEGEYIFTNIPYGVVVTITFQKIQGYEYASTYSKYFVTLKGSQSEAIENGSVYLATTNWYENRANYGVYNILLPDTGQDILPIFILSVLAVLFLFLFIIYGLTKK